jgi:hypothetical protein
VLTDYQIWYRPNAQSKSIGNLELHLYGNLNKWILSSIGTKDFQRIRQAEFDAEKQKAKVNFFK